MKVKALSLLASLFFAIGPCSFSADIPISGRDHVYSTGEYTFYATPPTPIASGTTYTWQIGNGTIVAQNTDPAAGPIYVTVGNYPHVLAQDAIEIADNWGNHGIKWIEVWGWGLAGWNNPFGNKETYKQGASVWASATLARLEAAGSPEEKRKKAA